MQNPVNPLFFEVFQGNGKRASQSLADSLPKFGEYPAIFGFSGSRLALNKSVSLLFSNAQLGILPSHSIFAIRSFSSSTSSNLNGHSFIVSYLINSCGLTLKSAQSVSKNRNIRFQTRERPDSVLRLLREHGFTNSQISKIVKSRPEVLLAQLEKTLLPKLEFLRSIGVSRPGLSIIVSRNPDLLACSLKHCLIPSYEILKSVLVSDEKVVRTLNHMGNRSFYSLQKRFSNNSSLLRGLGISQSFISYLVTQSPSVMCQEVGKFAEGVKKVMKLGFDPSKLRIVEAVRVFHLMSHKTWEHKMQVYRRWGFSEDEIWLIFRKCPTCMAMSEKKIMATMDFLVCKMSWQPAAVARVPVILCLSLEKRVMPRCSVVRVLLSKGLIKADIHLSSVLQPSEKLFLERSVIKYQEHVPQLLDIYQRKMGLTELGFAFDDKFKISGLKNV
ncbi:transcription termination factor MTERF4, chloroplastic-like [Hevea brasiliensis]|nr:transcription termination factor MTERF4, chloroplastic-like [Hevea brasiliensis]